jgi:hypothetical protein
VRFGDFRLDLSPLRNSPSKAGFEDDSRFTLTLGKQVDPAPTDIDHLVARRRLRSSDCNNDKDWDDRHADKPCFHIFSEPTTNRRQSCTIFAIRNPRLLGIRDFRKVSRMPGINDFRYRLNAEC